VLTVSIVPAQAFDCGKAASPIEKAICTDRKIATDELKKLARPGAVLPE
jgi:uncharacterized protein